MSIAVRSSAPSSGSGSRRTGSMSRTIYPSTTTRSTSSLQESRSSILRSPRARWRTAHRVLVPGGRLVGSAPNAFRLKSRIRFALGRHPESDATHLQLFTPAMLRDLLSGFASVEQTFAVGRYLRWSPRLMGRVQVFVATKSAAEPAGVLQPDQREPGVELGRAVGHPRDRELAAARARPPAPSSGRSSAVAIAAGERGRVVGPHEHAGLAVDDELGQRADVRRDDRAAPRASPRARRARTPPSAPGGRARVARRSHAATSGTRPGRNTRRSTPSSRASASSAARSGPSPRTTSTVSSGSDGSARMATSIPFCCVRRETASSTRASGGHVVGRVHAPRLGQAVEPVVDRLDLRRPARRRARP